MEQVIYIVALVVYGIFIIRFILSWIGGDFGKIGEVFSIFCNFKFIGYLQ